MIVKPLIDYIIEQTPEAREAVMEQAILNIARLEKLERALDKLIEGDNEPI